MIGNKPTLFVLVNQSDDRGHHGFMITTTGKDVEYRFNRTNYVDSFEVKDVTKEGGAVWLHIFRDPTI